MPLLVNLRHLEQKSLRLKGELPVEELELDGVDELVHVSRPLRYDLEVQELEKSLLTQGSIELLLECECSRCLKPFEFPVRLDPWALHLPLEGDDATAVINDSVDLTPHIREDMLLGFPQHPLCKPECAGLPPAAPQNGIAETPERAKQGSSAWTDLNKLKF